jgi:hypothetical protein
MFYIAMEIPPADFWIGSKKEIGIENMQLAFGGILAKACGSYWVA